MKRLISIALILCCVSGIGNGFAEEPSEALRVLDNWAKQDYVAKYPDRKLETIELSYDEQERSDLQEVLASGQWDMAVVSTTEVSLSTLDDAGLLMDLRAVPELADKFENMFPALLKAVSRGEKRLALPAGMLFSQSMKLAMVSVVNHKGQEIHVRENLGFTAKDEPETFAQLCALAERYMALSKQVRKDTVFDVDSAMGNVRHYFLSYLIDVYTSQMADQNGRVDYDTPLFRESMEQLERMAKALAKETKIDYQEGNGGMGICGLMRDTGSDLIGEGKLLRLNDDDPRFASRMDIIIINPHTTHLSEALDYCSLLLAEFMPQFAPLMYETYDRSALVQLMREKNLVIAKESALQIEIDMAMAAMQRSDDADYYYTEEQIAEYRENVAPFLVFPIMPSVNVYAIAKDYVRGRLDVDGLIQKLNKAANHKTND